MQGLAIPEAAALLGNGKFSEMKIIFLFSISENFRSK